MSKSALIFIPDISGYTEFITQTENKHSNHIISELLEIIIQSNKIGLVVNEIEGDAVLFYKKGEPPSIEELVEQAKEMFINFHAHLKVIQRDNVCQCGACRSANNLTLKFITHYGTLNETVIQNFSKIVGADVILAHRLLKNNLGEREYLLITENYLSTQQLDTKKFEDWFKLIAHTEKIENFDEVNIKYSLLDEIKNLIPDAPLQTSLSNDNSAAGKPVYIDAPILLVHELLTDSDAKLDYVPNIKSVESSHSINRVNTSHSCVFDDLEIHFVTLKNEVSKKEINYVEEGELSIGVGFITDYRLKEEGSGTNVSISIFPKKSTDRKEFWGKHIFNKIKTAIVLMKARSMNNKNLLIFKAYCEKIYKERTKV